MFMRAPRACVDVLLTPKDKQTPTTEIWRTSERWALTLKHTYTPAYTRTPARNHQCDPMLTQRWQTQATITNTNAVTTL